MKKTSENIFCNIYLNFEDVSNMTKSFYVVGIKYSILSILEIMMVEYIKCIKRYGELMTHSI